MASSPFAVARHDWTKPFRPPPPNTEPPTISAVLLPVDVAPTKWTQIGRAACSSSDLFKSVRRGTPRLDETIPPTAAQYGAAHHKRGALAGGCRANKVDTAGFASHQRQQWSGKAARCRQY